MVSRRRKSAETDGAVHTPAVRADGPSAAPALTTLPGATGYAPVPGAVFPVWGSPEHSAWMAEISRRAFTSGDAIDINALDPIDPVHLRNGGGFDLDREDDG